MTQMMALIWNGQGDITFQTVLKQLEMMAIPCVDGIGGSKHEEHVGGESLPS